MLSFSSIFPRCRKIQFFVNISHTVDFSKKVFITNNIQHQMLHKKDPCGFFDKPKRFRDTGSGTFELPQTDIFYVIKLLYRLFIETK